MCCVFLVSGWRRRSWTVMGNLNAHKTDASQSPRDEAEVTQAVSEETEEETDQIHSSCRQKFPSDGLERWGMMKKRETLVKFAVENCQDESVGRWLRKNSECEAFVRLSDMFDFLKKHIDEEQKKNHGDSVHITFVAHGSIRDSMIPARCLLPLSTIRDVVLYSPWNCLIYADAAYAVATGLMKPQHRVFYCRKKDGCKIPDDKHRPTNLPDHWNSLREAGGRMIPNIMVSPLRPPEDGYWKSFESLCKKHGPPGRNRIIVPFILPEQRSESVPFSVVTLALSLVLRSSRFKATVHLAACLGDTSAGHVFDRDHLKEQYACTINNTVMTVSPDMFRSSSEEILKSG